MSKGMEEKDYFCNWCLIEKKNFEEDVVNKNTAGQAHVSRKCQL